MLTEGWLLRWLLWSHWFSWNIPFSWCLLSLHEICQLVTLTIGHWKVIVFHLRPFCDKKQKVKSWRPKTEINDLLCEKVVEGNDQNKTSPVQRPSVLVVNVYDLLTKKVVNFSLRPPAFDLLFLVTKRSQMKNNDLSVTNSQGHKLTYFL